MAYLDDTGLAYFWGRIKAWANSVFALLGHTHPASDVTLMTGYSKPASGSAIAASDTLNQAVGKLEAKADAALDDSNYVHKTVVETIVGSKRFFDCGIDYLTSVINKGDTPSSRLYKNFTFADKNGIALANRFGALEWYVDTDDSVATYLVAYPNIAGDTNSVTIGVKNEGGSDKYGFVQNGGFRLTNNNFIRCSTAYTRGIVPSSTYYYTPLRVVDSNNVDLSSIYIVYDTAKANYVSFLVYDGSQASANVSEQLGIGFYGDGTVFTRCPTPAANSDTTNIATTAWVRTFCNTTAGFVDKTSDQTISGTKTFSSTIVSSNYYTMRRNVNDSVLTLTGGTTTGAIDGGKLLLYGSSHSSSSGYCVLQGGNSSGYRTVEVRPNKIYLYTDRVEFPNSSTYAEIQLCANRTTGGLVIYSGSQNFDGAGLLLFGRSDSSNAGKFYLRASTRSSSSSSGTVRSLTGTPDGSIYWNGQAIQTSSDERLKRDFASVDDAVLDGWGLVDWLQFRFRDAVEEKGERARLHVGLVAQRVDGALLDAGVDVKRYGIVCHEHSEARTVRNLVTDAAAYTDEEGVFHEAVTHCDEEFVPGVDEWTVRYTEALCMEAAYMRRENARLKKRVADLEERLAALELKIA